MAQNATATDVEDVEVTDDEAAQLSKTIKNHVWTSMGIGLIPVPLVDFVGLIGVQISMLRKLAKAYDVPFSQDRVKNVVTSLIGGFLPTTMSIPLASLMKGIPFVGQTAGALAMPAVAGATTYAIAKVFTQHFASGGTFLNFNPDAVKEYYFDMFKEGEKVVDELKTKKPGNEKKKDK